MTSINTRWRDAYGRIWAWSLAAAVLAHAFLFLFLPRDLSDRLYEALIPSPLVFFAPGGPGAELEVLALGSPAREEPQETPPPEPEPDEVVVPVEAADAPVDFTIAEVATAARKAIGSEEGSPDGASEGESGPAGGSGLCPPRPLHLVVPRLPAGVDKKRARGQSVHFLVEVLSEGAVGEVRIEKGSRIAVLDQAALAAIQRMRYVPASRDCAGIVRWTRAEMRF